METDDDETRAVHFARQVNLLDTTFTSHGGTDPRVARAELERLMALPETTSGVIARALTIVTEGWPPDYAPGKVATVEAYLQRRLTAEHVAAQEKMSAAAERLQEAAFRVSRASYWMAFASFIVTAAALYIAAVK